MPLNWKPSNVFYGWWIVGACFLIALYTGGVIFFGFTAVFEPIANEFGWSYVQVSLAASLRGLEIGLLAPLFGLLVDRWGPRRLVFGGAIISGIGLMLLSRITSLGMFYVASILIAIGISTCTQTVLLTAVINWFRRNVGIVTGITVSGFAVGGLLVPLIAELIDLFEWRTTMVILGLGMWGICLPLSLFLRKNPEQYGYLPDGEASSTALVNEGLSLVQTTGEDIGARQALRSSAFWHIALSFVYHSLAVSAVVTHVMPYLSSVGISRVMSALIASAAPLVSIGGRLGFGWLGGRFDRRRLAAVCAVLMSLGLLFFGHVATAGIWMLVPFLILFGIGWGGSVTTRVALVMEYFGRKRFGTMHGLTIGVMMVGSIAGAPLVGWVFDKWGSYEGAWFAFAGLAIAPIVLLVTAPKLTQQHK